MTQDILPFTGERFTPECLREISYEHWHRYAFALSMVAGKQVLDAACGEGFGADMLASKAANVVAIDIDESSIEHANKRYGSKDNLSFRKADVTQLDALPDNSIDVIVSFETLEHVVEHDRMLEGFRRILRDDGVLLISTPDKKNYTDATGTVNPHHVRELYYDQFADLLERYFGAKKIYTQKLVFQSGLFALDHVGPPEVLVQTQAGIARAGYPPMYYLAVCAHAFETLASLPGLSIFGDAEESVYAHYNQEVRFGMWARQRIWELEAQVAELKRIHDQQVEDQTVEDLQIEDIQPQDGQLEELQLEDEQLMDMELVEVPLVDSQLDKQLSDE
ncbi:MAG: class I SAM-dependent methyltransferase [Arenimonas sp.]